MKNEINQCICMPDDALLGSIERKDFGDIIKCLGIDLEKIFPTDRKLNKYLARDFNYMLKKLKQDFNINIIDSISYIERDYASLQTILGAIDDSTKFELKRELAGKNNIKIEESAIKKFISF